jgi:hypothetical protein
MKKQLSDASITPIMQDEESLSKSRSQDMDMFMRMTFVKYPELFFLSLLRNSDGSRDEFWRDLGYTSLGSYLRDSLHIDDAERVKVMVNIANIPLVCQKDKDSEWLQPSLN